MAANLQTLGIDRMSIRERLDLIEQIWDSLPDPVSPEEVPDWHLAELKRRRSLCDSNPSVGTPWRNLLNQLDDAR